jgi:hypothetical protein
MAWHDNADWSPVPEYLRCSLKHYVGEGRIPGDLLVGLLSNHLDMTIAACDTKRFRQIPAILGFVHMYLPEACYGTPERLAFWERVGGLKGLSTIAEYGTRGDEFP